MRGAREGSRGWEGRGGEGFKVRVRKGCGGVHHGLVEYGRAEESVEANEGDAGQRRVRRILPETTVSRLIIFTQICYAVKCYRHSFSNFNNHLPAILKPFISLIVFLVLFFGTSRKELFENKGP